uniref:Uncharacterized protein n=1 Tax=Rhizophora mucronata TaxID=61149 RepID=A0A2P2P8Q5_RHIMU
MSLAHCWQCKFTLYTAVITSS